LPLNTHTMQTCTLALLLTAASLSAGLSVPRYPSFRYSSWLSRIESNSGRNRYYTINFAPRPLAEVKTSEAAVTARPPVTTTFAPATTTEQRLNLRQEDNSRRGGSRPKHRCVGYLPWQRKNC